MAPAEFSAAIDGRARRLRIQYPEARYHVINRGNVRPDIFATPGAIRSFLAALEQAAKQFAWRVPAFVVPTPRTVTGEVGCGDCRFEIGALASRLGYRTQDRRQGSGGPRERTQRNCVRSEEHSLNSSHSRVSRMPSSA